VDPVPDPLLLRKSGGGDLPAFSRYCEWATSMAVTNNNTIIVFWGVRSRVVVKALCCKPEDRGFETRRGDFFQFT
jgi:hypothetical protein